MAPSHSALAPQSHRPDHLLAQLLKFLRSCRVCGATHRNHLPPGREHQSQHAMNVRQIGLCRIEIGNQPGVSIGVLGSVAACNRFCRTASASERSFASESCARPAAQKTMPSIIKARTRCRTFPRGWEERVFSRSRDCCSGWAVRVTATFSLSPASRSRAALPHPADRFGWRCCSRKRWCASFRNPRPVRKEGDRPSRCRWCRAPGR